MKWIVVILITIVLTSGCDKHINPDYKDIYTLALESLMEEENGLNSDMKYLAINFKTLSNIDENDVSMIMKYFAKYDVEVLDESFNSLNDKGMVFESNYIEGVLLEVTNVEVINKKKFKVECSKFRSGKGAIGLECIIIFTGGSWKVEETKITWIS